MNGRLLQNAAVVLLLCLLAFFNRAEAQTLVDFNSASDLSTNFNSAVPLFTNILTGGIGGSGSVSIGVSQSDLLTYKTGIPIGGAGTVYTVSAFFYNAANAGYGGLGFAAADVNALAGNGATTVGMGMITHAGGGYFVNNGTVSAVSYSGDQLVAGNWYKILFSATDMGSNTFNLIYQIWNSGADGTLGTLITEQIRNGVVNSNMGSAVAVFAYFSAKYTTSAGRMQNVDNFATSGSPLPVQLTSFTAALTGGSSVTLHWTTASEVNNYGFYVQSKRTGETDFADISGAFLAGHGTTIAQNAYSHTVAGAADAGTAFRLKQVDLDGAIHFSEPIMLGVTGVAETAPIVFALNQNYPNPFNPSTQFRFSVAKSGFSTLTIHNLLGQEIGRIFEGATEAGRYYVARFDGQGLPSGVYFARLQSGSDSQMRRMVLLK